MKEKIILLIIGILVGAVISTGIFYIYTTSNNNCNSNTQMNGNTPPNISNGQPPEKPSGDNSGQPPQMPNEDTSQNNN